MVDMINIVDRRLSWVLFLLTFFCYSYFIQLDDGANQRSRRALIMSLVQHHQLNIDPYEEHTGDKPSTRAITTATKR